MVAALAIRTGIAPSVIMSEESDMIEAMLELLAEEAAAHGKP